MAKRRKLGSLGAPLVRVLLVVALVVGCAPLPWAAAMAQEAGPQARDLTATASVVAKGRDAHPSAAQDGSGSTLAAAAAAAADEDQETISAVEKLIRELPKPERVTLKDEDAIQEAAQAYDDLTKSQKSAFDADLKDRLDKVVEALEEKKAEAAQRAADERAAGDVAALIDSLPSANRAGASDRAALDAAQAAYDALTTSQKALVSASSVKKLGDVASAVAAAEQAIAEEEARAAADREAAQAVEALIAALPGADSVSAGDKAAAEQAQNALDSLTASQGELVDPTLRQKLADVLAKIVSNERQAAADREAAQAVEALIAALPDADSAGASDKRAVEAARDSFNSLTESQKDLVDPALRQKLSDVGQSLVDREAADAVSALIQALPDPNKAGSSDRPALQAAQNAFESLTDTQKRLVPDALRTKLNRVNDAVIMAELREEAGTTSGTHYVSMLLMKWDEPDEFDIRHFVGDAPIVESKYKSIYITEFGKTVQLTGWYASTDGTGIIYQTADSTTDIGSFDLTWKSSDEKVATVSPSGLVTPRGKNGSVKITATVADKNVYQNTAPQASVTIHFSGQEGRYVKQVDILNEDGDVIGERSGGVTLFEDKDQFYQLHARITWFNVETGQETTVDTGQGEDYSAKGLGTTVKWGVSTSSAFSINENTGRLRTGRYSGNAFVTFTVVGGVGGADVVDTASVQLDTGEYEYNPAEKLELKVVYEERPNEPVKEASYTYEELLGMLQSKRVNATVVNASRFGVISAEGFLFKDVVELVSVDDTDVLQYRFTTADGYDNPVSYDYLFGSGPRYYFPNYDLGGSQAEGEIVSPVLAYRSAMQWNRSEAIPDEKLDDGNRFRLVFGCLASGDANTSFQIYYITGITVVLKGSPSAGGEGGDPAPVPPQDPTGGRESGPSGPSAPEGTQTPSGPIGPSGPDGESLPSNAPSSGNNDNGGSRSETPDEGRANTAGNSAANAQDSAESTAGETPSASVEGQGSATAQVLASGTDIDSAKHWRVYQMMNKSNSDVPDWDDENPIAPFAAPIVLGTFAAGIGATGIGFRRRLK